MVTLRVRNESCLKRLYRSDALSRIAGRVCKGEGLRKRVEISLLLCDDAMMKVLNRKYRNKNATTDVLSFEQPELPSQKLRALGDIVISLQTVEYNCGGDRALMRGEIALLFCHGLLHLLGYDHHTARERREMTSRQAAYLEIPDSAAWNFGPKKAVNRESRN